jgi:CelD/BcsL family acetyltransferase involved in cellulose biosynthesis
VNVVEFNSIDAIDGALWDDLWNHCPDATIFQRQQWIQAWVATFAPAADTLKVLTVFDGARLVGLAPLVREAPPQGTRDPGRWRIVGDDYSDYQTFLAWNGSQQIIERLLTASDKCLPVGATLLLRDLPQFSALALHLAGKAASGASGVQAGEWIACPTLCIRANPLGVARVLGKRSVARHERSLSSQGEVSVQHLHEAAQIEPLLPGLFAQHIARWSGTRHPSLFLKADNQRFYRAVTARLTPIGGLLVSVLRVNERIAAQHFGLRSAGSLLWYKPAFDVDLRATSPGEVLLKHLIEFASRNGLDELDFTRGEEAFKMRFASTVAFNRHFIWHPRLGARLKARLAANCKSVFRKLRRTAAVSPWLLGGASTDANTGNRVLLLDAQRSVASQIVESLTPSGIDVHVAIDTNAPNGARSASARTLLQPPTGQAAALRSWVSRVDQEQNYALIVPCSESSLRALATLPEDHPIRAKAVLAPRDALAISGDRNATEELARRLGVPVAQEIDEKRERTDRQGTVLCLYVNGKLAWYFTRCASGDAGRSVADVDLRRNTASIERGIWNASHAAVVHLAKRVLDGMRWHGFAAVTVELESGGSPQLADIRPYLVDSLSQAAASGVNFPVGLWRIARCQPLGPQPD